MDTLKRAQIRVGPTEKLSLRVSAAALTRVQFKHPENDARMLALERKATLVEDGKKRSVQVRAQPFGGAVRISNVKALEARIGAFRFDSERSHAEADFRIFIQPGSWPPLKAFLIKHFESVDDSVLETSVVRELVEEFEDCMQVKLLRAQFTSASQCIVIEEMPAPTDNTRALGVPTVRVYRIFETTITDQNLVETIIEGSGLLTDSALEQLAQRDLEKGGRGRANGVLALPHYRLVEFYSQLPLQARNQPAVFENHTLSETVSAVIDEITVPKYQKFMMI